MTVTRPRIPAGFLIVVLAICCAAVRADAQLQDTDQRTCIKAVNKAGQGVLRAQGRENLNCLKRAGKGQLAGTFDECLSADAKQKVAKAQAKTVSADAKFCDVLPDVAYAGPSETNRAAAYEETRLVAEVVASSVLGPADGDNAVRCQATVTKLYEKSATTFMKAFNICVRKALASGPVVEATIEACIGADPNGKIQRAEEKVLATMIKRCNGVLLAGLNSGAFDGACDDADVAADCSPKISEIVRCRTLEVVVTAATENWNQPREKLAMTAIKLTATVATRSAVSNRPRAARVRTVIRAAATVSTMTATATPTAPRSGAAIPTARHP
jgi:hypothetical protein